MLARLEGAVHGDDEGVVGERHDITLGKHLVDLIPQDEILLVDLLEGEPLSRLLVLDEVDGPVGAVRDQFQLLEVVVGGVFEGGLLGRR